MLQRSTYQTNTTNLTPLHSLDKQNTLQHTSLIQTRQKNNIQEKKGTSSELLKYIIQFLYMDLHLSTLRANPYPEVTDLICRLPLLTFVY